MWSIIYNNRTWNFFSATRNRSAEAGSTFLRKVLKLDLKKMVQSLESCASFKSKSVLKRNAASCTNMVLYNIFSLLHSRSQNLPRRKVLENDVGVWSSTLPTRAKHWRSKGKGKSIDKNHFDFHENSLVNDKYIGNGKAWSVTGRVEQVISYDFRPWKILQVSCQNFWEECRQQ